MSSDLPPPSQRLHWQPRRPKPTASEMAADYAEYAKRVNENLPMFRPETPPFPLEAPRSEPSAHGSTGQISGPHQTPASVSGSMPANAPDDGAPQHSMASDAASKASPHLEPAVPVIPGTVDGYTPGENEDGHPGGQHDNDYPPPTHYDNGYSAEQYWDYAPQHGLPTDRPTIPRQRPAVDSPSNPGPRFPANFPAYHATQNMNEIAAYLANASYVISLGGTPLADLKYGIIIVPAGEESLLFGPPPQSVINQDFVDAIDDANRNYDRALRMHDPDKDIEEFALHRFDDDFASVSAGAQQNVEATLANEKDGAGGHGAKEDDSATADVEEPQPKRPRRGPQRRSARAAAKEASSARNNAGSSEKVSNIAKQVAPAMDTPAKPQGRAKTRRSPRVAGRGANTPSQPAAKRTLRGKK